MRAKLSLAIATVLVSAIAATAPADAACKKFGFTVNDYGKDGPTNDAKNLLDKHIAEWAAQNGVTAYQTGKKNVSCELFLDVILFDEHTCTASASVCWGDGVKPNNKGAEQASSKAAGTEQAEVIGDGNGEVPPAPVSKAVALGIPVQPQTAAAAAPAEAAVATEAAAAPTAPVEQIAAPAETPAATPAVQTPAATTGGVETGALQFGQGAAAPQNVTPPPAPPAPDKDRAAAASAAAAAAAAAERAAMAAEMAANAAKEAAAAAVAASAASKAPATVPPLDHASGATPAHNE
ncbi:MAG: hypothetical protein ABI457_00845 [Hyphomicrobium sp.]